MNKYFTVEFVEPSYVVYAYRGTELDNTLEISIPPDDQAAKVFNIDSGLSQKELDQILMKETLPFVQGNLGQPVLVRVSGTEVMIWHI